MTSNEIRLQVPASELYQSALSEAAHKVTSRQGWPAEQVARFVALTDLATAASCSYDAATIELVIDQAGEGLQATVSGIAGDGTASSASIAAFEKVAASTADKWSVSSTSRVLNFQIG